MITLTPKRKTRNTEPDKKATIIEVARILFTTKGYEDTSIADIAEQANIGVGTVYKHFKNKIDILEAVQGDWEFQFVQKMAKPEILALPHHKRARPLMEEAFAICDEYSDMVQLMGLQPQGVGAVESQSNHGRIQESLAIFLREGIELGSFRPVDVEIAAAIAFGMVHGALQECYDVNGGKNKERYIDTLVDIFEHWLMNPALLEVAK